MMDRPALVPELYVSSLAESLDFYVELLGFEIEYDRPEEKFASLKLGNAHLMLEEARSLSKATPEELARGEWRAGDLERPFGRGMNLEIDVDDVEPIESRIREREYPVLLGRHEKTHRIKGEVLKVRRLLLADPDGYLIRLSQRLGRTKIE
jgi:catechol 2,3-dioxygenase-like lactoylglutathione lyase family enzyme